MISFVTESYEETLQKAGEFAKTLPKGSVIGFVGGLGMGKTAFTTGFVKGLGIDADVSSPTFAICNDYIGNSNRVYHFDMYRVESWDDLYSTGFFDYIAEGGILACEWSENIENALPDDTIYVEFTRIDDEKREITITKKGE